ncbi:MAG: SAM-dependent methyltransferase [Rhodospirillaceae bacterium]|nr:SAM-dependent methyltransferase [Rhodospirillaceae bacterium]
MKKVPKIFDSQAIAAHRKRAEKNFSSYNFLYTEINKRLKDRKTDIKRSFTKVIELSAWGNNQLDKLAQLQPATIDLVESNFLLHWINDLPGLLLQIRAVLEPDGLFLAAFPGGDTLHELREALNTAETITTGGVSPRVSPFVGLSDAAALLQKSGFALPVADLDRITVTYKNIFTLMRDLRGMGETSALLERIKHFTKAEIFYEAEKFYKKKFSDSNGNLLVTFDIVFMTGWAPHHSQPLPRKPGSAKVSLERAIGKKL